MNQANYDRMHRTYQQFSLKVTAQCNAILRINLGLVFLWFGLLKFVLV